MTTLSLEDRIQQAGGAVHLFRDSSALAVTGPITGAEFSNWRDEQLAWRESAALFDLSHHMTDLNLRGPDALKVLSDFGVNSLANLTVGKAKQYVATDYDGYVIGDAILDYVSDDRINLVGTEAVTHWIQFQIETGQYRVDHYLDKPSPENPAGHPEIYRYQLNGPTAVQILEKATGGPVPAIKFFNAGMLTIAGVPVRALGHTMSRAQGFELSGPWAEAKQVRDALFEAGQEFGLTLNGARASTSGTLESGWLPLPMPAIFTGEQMKSYREWLPGDSWEANGSLGGSLASEDIADYYLRPAEVGYGKLVKFDHDFVGRDALERAAESPQRHKVTLAWNSDDVIAMFATLYKEGRPAKYLEMPTATYSRWQYDQVLAGGKQVGVSTIAGYTYNERRTLSLAVVDPDVELGSEVTVLWGEENGGTNKAQVERHVQTEVRAVVHRVPYSDVYNK